MIKFKLKLFKNWNETIITPQLNTIPKINWGQYVYRFIKGYKTIIGIELIPINIENKLNCKSIIKLNRNNKYKKIIASFFEILFDVKGRLAVREIFLSILISIKSLIMHPALLIKNAPIKKKIYHLIKLIEFEGTKVRANQLGHMSNIKPLGLEKRISSRKYFIFKGTILSNIGQ